MLCRLEVVLQHIFMRTKVPLKRKRRKITPEQYKRQTDTFPCRGVRDRMRHDAVYTAEREHLQSKPIMQIGRLRFCAGYNDTSAESEQER